MTRKVLIVLGCLLLVAALGLTGYNLFLGRQAGQTSQKILDTMQEKLQTAPTEAGTEEAPEVPNYVLAPNMDMPEIEIDGVAYIGTLAMPTLDRELPVITATTDALLQVAPCRFSGSAYLDDMVIGAHNYASHFGNIGNLSYGDPVTFTDVTGNVFTYRVATVEVLDPDQADQLCSGEWPLTLYTCTLGGGYRTTVRCNLKDTMN